MNSELERMWKEAAVALFKVLSQHLLGGTEENHEVVSVACLWASLHILTKYFVPFE
jgi:hypothetical protein